MAEAEPVIGAVLPDANVPTSVRSGDVPVVRWSTSDLGSILDTWRAGHADGIACVIGAARRTDGLDRYVAMTRATQQLVILTSP